MANNNDDNFDEDNTEEFDTDLGFDDTTNSAGGRNNALMRIGMIAGALVIVVVGIFMLGGSGDKTPTSRVSGGPVDTAGAGNTQEPTPEYRDAIDEYNRNKTDAAKNSGGSVIPITIDPARAQLEPQGNANDEDPTQRYARIQDEYNRQKQAQSNQSQAQQDQAAAQARAQAVQTLSQNMSTYLNSAVRVREPVGMTEMDVASTGPAALGNADGSIDGGAGTTAGVSQPSMILPAATIEYGQLMIEANTDAPGPVLAMIASGKLAGSRLLGKFQKTEEYLTLNFDQVVTKDGRALPIQAVALDPDTTLPGMVTEIDRKYFQRYILPAAADFISGVGQAIAETQTSTTQTSSSTTTESNDPNFDEAIAQGISDSFDGLADAIKDSGRDTQPMLRIAAGTPIGLLFTQAVMDQTNAEQAQQQALEAQRQGLTGAASAGQLQPYLQGTMPYLYAPVGVVPQTGAVAGVPTAAPVIRTP